MVFYSIEQQNIYKDKITNSRFPSSGLEDFCFV